MVVAAEACSKAPRVSRSYAAAASTSAMFRPAANPLVSRVSASPRNASSTSTAGSRWSTLVVSASASRAASSVSSALTRAQNIRARPAASTSSGPESFSAATAAVSTAAVSPSQRAAESSTGRSTKLLTGTDGPDCQACAAAARTRRVTSRSTPDAASGWAAITRRSRSCENGPVGPRSGSTCHMLTTAAAPRIRVVKSSASSTSCPRSSRTARTRRSSAARLCGDASPSNPASSASRSSPASSGSGRRVSHHHWRPLASVNSTRTGSSW